MTEVSTVSEEQKIGDRAFTFNKALVHFTVEAAYKGISSPEVQVKTGLGGGDCGYPFRRGERYLVYAYVDPQTSQLTTSICTLTKPLAHAESDLAYIRTVPTEAAGTRLYGQVLDFTRDSHGIRLRPKALPGATVRLTAPGGVRLLTSNGKGEYQWTRLPADHYKLGAELAHYVALPAELKFDLTGHGCFSLDLLLQSNGQISGHLYDEHGTPLSKEPVELMDWESNGPSEMQTETDESGRYQFVAVRPGDFLVGVNLSGPPTTEHPYLRTFYPGTEVRDSAALLHLEEAGQLTGQDIYVRTKCESRIVQGVVLWPNGPPATNATISLVYPDYPWHSDSQPGPDAQGRFSVQVLTHLRTILWVQAPDNRGVWMNAGQIELPSQGTVRQFTLVLSHEPPKWNPPQ